MATFTLAQRNLEARIACLKQLAEIARETGGDLAEERDGRRYFSSVGDEQTLRGIPAIGPGVSGAMPGTSPHRVR